MVSLLDLLGLSEAPSFAVVAIDPNQSRQEKAEAIISRIGSLPGGSIRVASLENAPGAAKELSDGHGCDAVLEVNV